MCLKKSAFYYVFTNDWICYSRKTVIHFVRFFFSLVSNRFVYCLITIKGRYIISVIIVFKQEIANANALVAVYFKRFTAQVNPDLCLVFALNRCHFFLIFTYLIILSLSKHANWFQIICVHTPRERFATLSVIAEISKPFSNGLAVNLRTVGECNALCSWFLEHFDWFDWASVTEL